MSHDEGAPLGHGAEDKERKATKEEVLVAEEVLDPEQTGVSDLQEAAASNPHTHR